MYWARLLLHILLVPLSIGLARADSCDKNPVLSVLKAFQATAFCSQYLGIQTQTITIVPSTIVGVTQTTTVTATITDPQTLTTDALSTTTTTVIAYAPPSSCATRCLTGI